MASREFKNFRLFLVLATLFFSLELIAAPKLTKVETKQNEIVLYFNSAIDSKDFKFTHFISNDELRKNIYDIKAELTLRASPYSFAGDIDAKVAQFTPTLTRVVFYSKNKFYTSSRNIDSKTVAIRLKAKSITEESKTTTSKKSQIPLYRDKVIVIDPGHGGKDCGAMSVLKYCEKHIVLKISKYIRDELKNLGYKKVYLTRESDIFITLKDRTKYANDKNANIFISIHANALDGKSSEKFMGFETYFLSNARSDRAKRVAALENKEDIAGMNFFSKDTVLNILNTQRIVASNKLALDIQNGALKSLRGSYSKINDGGVREGPFWVLVGAQMPSVLVEVGYVSNRLESKRLDNTHYQKLVAKGVAQGIDSYFLKN